MNKIFSIVWNHTLQAWVVASELASTRGKRSGLTKKALTVLVGGAVASIAHATPPPVNALPTGGQVAAGQVGISQSGSTMNIQQATQNGIINWNTFNVGADATVNFQQPNSSSATLNRVMSSDASKIYGQLNANGQVFLINPNGVLFGKNARVDVGGLVASTMNIRDDDFLSGKYEFNADSAIGSVINEGELLGNYIALLAPEVRNDGIVIARQGTVAMAAGQKVTLSIAGDHLINVQVEQADFDTLVENRHLVEVEGGLVLMSAQSASELLAKTVNSGEIRAAGISTDGGIVRLVASSEVAHSGSISVDAGENGQGGTAILLADLVNLNSKTSVSGSISAKGGINSGDGGFIDTSASHVQIADSAIFDTRAINGDTGQWLIDPVDFTIGVNGDMSAATLMASLGSSNVTIQSINGSTGTNGDIFVNDSLSWSTHALTLSADRHIKINAPIAVTGGGGLNLEFGQASSAGDFFNIGNYFISAPVDLDSSTSFSTKFGNDGITVNYTVITDEVGLLAVDADMTGNYVLGTNVSVATNPWNPLGNATGDFTFGTTGFTGIFDGLGHTIDGLTRANTTNSTGIGLFGQIGDQFTPGGMVQNLGITNVDLAGLSNVGALAGANLGIVNNVYSTGSVTGSDVVGLTTDDAVAAIGGLVGQNRGGIASSYSSVNVTATSGDQSAGEGFGGGIGGLVGVNEGAIDSNYATGSVSGIRDVGGLVGYADAGISASYSTGAVSGTTNVGGLVGALSFAFDFAPGLLMDTFWDTTTSGQATSASRGGNSSTGLTSAAMQQQSNFSGFDFTNTWIMYEGLSQPLLRSMLTPYIVTAEDQSSTYDGTTFNGFTSAASLSSQPAVVTGTLAFSGAATTATDAGDYTISLSGLDLNNAGKVDQHGYYLVFVDGTYTINKADLTVQAGNDSKTYDGQAYSSNNGVSYSGFVNSEDSSVLSGSLTFAGDSQGAINAGTYAITASGLTTNNYNLSYVDGTLTVDKADLTVTANDANKTYDGLAYNGGNGVSYSGFVAAEDDSVLGGTLSFAGDALGAIDAGAYTITASGQTASNYNLNYVDGALTVDKADLTVTANDASKTYDGLAHTGGNGVSYSGFVAAEDDSVLGGALLYDGDSQGAINAGAYTLTASGLSANNYNLNYVDGALTVDKADLTVTANNDTKTYDGQAYTGGNGVSYTGFVNGEDASDLAGALNFSGNSQGAINAGSYTITAGGLTSGNYAITFVDGGLTVGQAALTVTANNDTKTYDGLAYSNGNGVSYAGFATGDDASDLGGSLTYSGDSQGAINAGSYTITASGLTSGNYTITFVDGELTVGKATLTVTADDKTITEGDAIPALTVSYSGFVNGETLGTSGVTGAGTASTTATADSAVADYGITAEQGSLASNNYTFNLVDGTLTIAASTPETPNTPAEPQLETAVEIVQETLNKNKGGAEGEGQTQTKLDTNKDKKDADQTENKSPNEIIQSVADKHCEDCKVSDDLDLSGKNKLAELTKTANDAKKAAQEAAKNTETKAAQAEKTKQQAELAKKAADADPTNQEKQRAAAQAVKKAEESKDALIKATADQYVKAKEAAQKQIEVEQGGPDARTEKIDKILKAVNDRGLAIFAAWASAGKDLTKTEEENARKKEELKKYMAAGEEAHKFLETQDQDTVMRVVKLADDLNKVENAKRELEEVQKKAQEKQDKVDQLTQKAKTSQEAADKAREAAEANPDSQELVLKAKQLTLQADKDRSELIDAKLVLSDAETDVLKKSGEVQEAQDKADLTKATIAQYLADKDKEASEKLAEEKAELAVNNSALAGVGEFFAKANIMAADQAEVNNKANQEKKKEAQQQQKEAETMAKATVEKAKRAAYATKNIPEKAAIIAQLEHLEPLLHSLVTTRAGRGISGPHATAADSAWRTLRETLKDPYGMPLDELKKTLESIKSNAKSGLATQAEYASYNSYDKSSGKLYLDTSHRLMMGLQPDNLRAAAAKGADQAAQKQLNDAAQKLQWANEAATKAEEDARKAIEALKIAERRKDQAPAKLREKAREMAAFAAQAKQQAEDAKVELAAAEVEAKKARAESAAVNVIAKKAASTKAANAKVQAEKELEAAIKKVGATKQLAQDTAKHAERLKADAEQAKADVVKAKQEQENFRKLSAEKEKQIPLLNQKAEQEEQLAEKKREAAKAAGETWKSLEDQLDKLGPDQEAANNAQLAAARELALAKAALDKLGAMSGFKAGNVLELAVSIGSEVDKSNKRGDAEARVARAQADYDQKLKVAEQKTAEYNALATKTNDQVEVEKQAVKEANDAILSAAKSRQAAEQAKLDKANADTNAENYTQFIKDSETYAVSVEQHANHVATQAVSIANSIASVEQEIKDAQQKVADTTKAAASAKAELDQAKVAADNAAKVAKEAE